MSKKESAEREVKTPAYTGYELSAVTEYYIYGRGNADDYGRAVKGIKEEIREIAYGDRQAMAESDRSERRIKKSALAVAIFALAAIAVIVMSVVASGVEALGLFKEIKIVELWKACFGGDTESYGTLTAAAGISLAAAAICLVITFLSAVFGLKASGKGTWLKIISAAVFIVTVWAPIAMTISKDAVGVNIIYWVLAGLTLLMAIASLLNKKKKETEE